MLAAATAAHCNWMNVDLPTRRSKAEIIFIKITYNAIFYIHTIFPLRTTNLNTCSGVPPTTSSLIFWGKKFIFINMRAKTKRIINNGKMRKLDVCLRVEHSLTPLSLTPLLNMRISFLFQTRHEKTQKKSADGPLSLIVDQSFTQFCSISSVSFRNSC